MDKTIEKTIEALKKNNMNAVFAPDKESLKKTVEDMLFEGCTITAGGSVSLKESGIDELIKSPRYKFADRNRNNITAQEQLEVYQSVVGCDFYFCSSNAVTQNGELINVDGNCNRISAIAFGPKKVIMAVGKNKIVSDVSKGFLRVKKIAAPKNCVRLGLNNPCVKTGHCISLDRCENPDITDGCASPQRICRDYLVSGPQQNKGRITVILCGFDLGY